MKRTLLAIAVLLLAPAVLGDAPVDEARLTLREEFLRLINRDRMEFGLPPVRLDPAVSAMADEYCRQQIRNGTSGHFTLDGLAPYMRYSFAGGNDAVSENAAAWSANYTFGARALVDMLRRSQREMMREVAPHDGHRRTILDPYATHVGIGLAWQGGEFRLTQEFLRHFVEWTRPLPRNASTADQVLCSGKPIPGYEITAITVHHEPLPQAMTTAVANAITSYSLPETRREYLPRLPTLYRRSFSGTLEQVRETYSDGRRGDFPLSRNGSFAFVIPFADGPGVYTIVVWVAPQGSKQTIAATNVSIRVNESGSEAMISSSSR